ncbi:uncharacterized protein LOC129308956 [Prosopis cineraria]|uniref:uncharacterized protein LOC129308956 n=1 Tax=Prosopis cineraria TaxID=364024 RepID=UPI00240FC111|nr:uncharacterized protein LOC129308956 [Prosopis cineraria]
MNDDEDNRGGAYEDMEHNEASNDELKSSIDDNKDGSSDDSVVTNLSEGNREELYILGDLEIDEGRRDVMQTEVGETESQNLKDNLDFMIGYDNADNDGEASEESSNEEEGMSEGEEECSDDGEEGSTSTDEGSYYNDLEDELSSDEGSDGKGYKEEFDRPINEVRGPIDESRPIFMLGMTIMTM